MAAFASHITSYSHMPSYELALKSHYPFPIADSIFSKIYIHTDRTNLSKNFMELSVQGKLMNPDLLERINTFVTTHFHETTACLHTFSHVGPIRADYIHVEYPDIRRIIDILFHQREISIAERADVETIIRESEKCSHFASLRTENISLAQKELLLEFISFYVETIRSKVPEGTTAQDYVKCIARALKICSPKDVQKNISSFLWTAGFREIPLDKDGELSESLFRIAQVYNNTSNLEDTLMQLGKSLPSSGIIQQIILDSLI